MRHYSWVFSIFFLISITTHGEQNKSPEGTKAISLELSLKVQESIVQTNGVYYRKVEYKNELFYLRLLEPDRDHSQADFECTQGTPNAIGENQILISTKVSERGSLFVDGLRKVCALGKQGISETMIEPNLRIGFVFDESEKGLLKRKRFYLSPGILGGGLGVGFGADF